jgi:hypothetical protein
MTRYQKVVAIIPREPLLPNVEYEVSLEVDAAGETWSRTWRFNTTPPQPGRGGPRRG